MINVGHVSRRHYDSENPRWVCRRRLDFDSMVYRHSSRTQSSKRPTAIPIEINRLPLRSLRPVAALTATVLTLWSRVFPAAYTVAGIVKPGFIFFQIFIMGCFAVILRFIARYKPIPTVLRENCRKFVGILSYTCARHVGVCAFGMALASESVGDRSGLRKG